MDVTIDASGSHGHDAPNGYGYGYDASAGQAGIGSNGGNLSVTLSSVQFSNEPGSIYVSGTKTYSNGQVEYINNNYDLGKTGLIHFISRGGNGGNGGIGANGSDGYAGSDGIDATMYSNGTDGEPGGDGGDGGHGSSGGHGGDGGYVRISVNEHDAHLLMLLGVFDVLGGSGGNPGRHGIGGSGGRGGSGGSSYSWTETIPAVYEYPSENALTRYNYNSNTVDATIYYRATQEIDYHFRPSEYDIEERYNYESGMTIGSGGSDALTRYNGPPVEYFSNETIDRYDRPGETDIYYRRTNEIRLHGTVDADYHNDFRLIEPAEPPEPILITPEQIITHTNPGGYSGANGRNGYTPTEPLYKGSDGLNGIYEFGIINEYGNWEPRDEKFCKLEITRVECITQNNSRIFEPGSFIKIGMKVYNTGCPTPKYTPIRIELDEYNIWIINRPKVDAPLNLLKNSSKYIRTDQGMIIKINDPKIVKDGTPLSVPINLNKFKATMTKIERPVDIFASTSISFIIQYPINISEIISIRSPGGLQYEVFWFVNNISYLNFGRDSEFKRLIRTKLTRGDATGIEIDDQEIKYLEPFQSIQVTSRLLLDQNNNGIQQFTVTLQIGDSNDQPYNLKSIQTRKFTIKPPLAKDIPHLFLDVTKNECNNLNGSETSFCKDNGSINLTLSKEIYYSFKGLIKFGDGTLIRLSHSFNFNKDGFIYITQKTSSKKCDVNLTTYEDESHIFALIANTFDDRNNKINWNFQTINRLDDRLNKYSTPFKLRIERIIHYIEHGTRIFEPNCKGFIEKIGIFNEGEMPSPNNQDIIISLSPTSNIIPDDSFFRINKSINYCECFELENINLKFSIKNDENGFKNIVPLRIKDHFKFNTNIISINHILQNFDNFPLQEIIIQYPIEMGEYLGYRNPSATEEIYSLYWKIKNISNVEFGKSSNIGRLIVTSVDNNIPHNVLYIKEIESLISEKYTLETTKVKIDDKPTLNPFNFKLLLGSIESPETLLPIQSYPFHLLPLLREDTYKRFDLVFDLNDGRLTLNNQQINDYIKPGNFKLEISTPKSKDVKVGDVKIRGKLQYTNGWKIKINDKFTLDLSGWIYLYTNGKNNLSTGSIVIKIEQEDTHLLYLIDKSCLEKCEDQLYQVIDNSKILEYNRIYQFTLISYECIPEDDSGIYEPGSRIIICRIKVKNTGGMATPTSYDVEISINLLNSTEISLPKDNKLKLPKPIMSSEKKILNPIKSDDEKYLEFQINQQSKASKDKPLNITGMVNLRAIMFGINREITNFTLPNQFKIQYPIQICPDTKIQVIPYKNITRITWRLNNISQIDFGSESKIKRVIKIQVKIEKMSPENSLKFKTNRGLNDIFEQEISLLESKQSKNMFCELVRTLKNQHATVIDANLSITLYIGSINLPDREFDIEIRNKYIEVFPSYESNSDSDLLLVASSKTTKKNIIYWNNLCQEFGLSMSIWNIKREGHFDLFESSLVKDYLGKSIIILNDELNDENEFNQTIDYLNPIQFYQIVNNYNIKFLFIGTNIITDQKIKELFIPKEMIETKPIASYKKIKHYIKNTKKMIISEDNDEYKKSKEKNVQNLTKTMDLKCINTHLRSGNMNCFTSDESYKMNKLQKLSKSLQKIYPSHRHIFLSIINENINKNADYDQIILCKTTNRTKQYLTYNSIQLNDNHVKKISMIGLLSCISFSKKLEKLQQILFDSKQDLNQNILKSLIEADLAMELNGLCGLHVISKKMKLIISDILLTELELFRKYCEFVKVIISKEDSISKILKSNNLKTDNELLNDDLNIILSEENYKIIEQNHKKIIERIKKAKTEHQEQIELLEYQANCENLITFNREIGSEEINLLFNHGIEVNNIGSAEDIIETANKGLEAFNFGSEDTTIIMNQGIEFE
ncbi:collagen-like protein [Rhizophagus clarus]|uniref:Collagen-like protein n=1 Tax=Rhizophagus clarus TaxID=94130 RepID=A0A8H3QGU2_9GLOM|nr:collagen-like protein [Rhizophagus clarus]